jgi:hypothetical protein
MNVIVTEPQLNLFLRRRFSPEELKWLVNHIKEWIDEGESVDSAIYDSIRQFIKREKQPDIDEFGDEQSYWDSYLKYETPLVAYVKYKLDLV